MSKAHDYFRDLFLAYQNSLPTIKEKDKKREIFIRMDELKKVLIYLEENRL